MQFLILLVFTKLALHFSATFKMQFWCIDNFYFLYIFITSDQGCSKGISSVAFEVLIVNCQTCFKGFFSFNCLMSNFVFWKYTLLAGRRERLLWTFVLTLWNSTGKMMTCLRHNQIKFWVTAPVHKYTKK